MEALFSWPANVMVSGPGAEAVVDELERSDRFELLFRMTPKEAPVTIGVQLGALPKRRTLTFGGKVKSASSLRGAGPAFAILDATGPDVSIANAASLLAGSWAIVLVEPERAAAAVLALIEAIARAESVTRIVRAAARVRRRLVEANAIAIGLDASRGYRATGGSR